MSETDRNSIENEGFYRFTSPSNAFGFLVSRAKQRVKFPPKCVQDNTPERWPRKSGTDTWHSLAQQKRRQWTEKEHGAAHDRKHGRKADQEALPGLLAPSKGDHTDGLLTNFQV